MNCSFSAPDAGPDTAAVGRTFSDFTNGMQRISEISVEPGANLLDLNLPIDPNGVVYNTVARAPIAGATLTLLDAVTRAPLPEDCFDDPAQQNQVTPRSGFYKFDINFSDVACPQGADYLIEVSPPSVGNWIPGGSLLVPPSSNADTPPLSVPDCIQGGAADAIPATTLILRGDDVGARTSCIGWQRIGCQCLSPAPDARQHEQPWLTTDIQQSYCARPGPARFSFYHEVDTNTDGTPR